MSETVERCLTGETLPSRLADLAVPPERLFLRGELPRGPAVAIVGTRRPSPAYEEFARELAGQLASAGVAVLSGGAEGIDTAAHRGALAAAGVTVVVAAGGFDCPFPEQNADLFQHVVEAGGAYLSLVDAATPVHRSRFFARNACLVALAHAVVVVEAPFRSGARNAAAHARRLGRPLFAVPAAPWHHNGLGCLLELQLGARPLITARDLFKALRAQNLHPLGRPEPAIGPLLSRPESTSVPAVSDRAAVLAAVLGAVDGGAGSSDEICVASGLPVARVSELVLTLRLEGVLVTDPCGRLKIRNKSK